MKRFHYLILAGLIGLAACSGKPGPKKAYSWRQDQEGVHFTHTLFSITIPGKDTSSLVMMASNLDEGFSINSRQGEFPFYLVFFKKSHFGESKWDDEKKQRDLQGREEKGDYDIRFRQLKFMGVEAYETAWTNYLFRADSTAADTATVPNIMHYSRELYFVHDSIAYWLEITTENEELTDDKANQFFGSFHFNGKP